MHSLFARNKTDGGVEYAICFGDRVLFAMDALPIAIHTVNRLNGGNTLEMTEMAASLKLFANMKQPSILPDGLISGLANVALADLLAAAAQVLRKKHDISEEPQNG